jgi:hypothetical protein
MPRRGLPGHMTIMHTSVMHMTMTIMQATILHARIKRATSMRPGPRALAPSPGRRSAPR